MNDYNDGKIYGWNGGKCPVHPNTLIKIFYRGILSSLDYKAKNVYWGHCGGCGDIVAFQVVKEHKCTEPLVVWANMYDNGSGYVYKSEEEANDAALHNIDRRAVKFIEVR
jgi:hypothetical protein